MSEENNEETEGEGKDAPAATKDSGDKPKTPQSIVDANAAAERLEEATKKHKEQLDRQEDMIARNILGGVTQAGQEQTKEKEETPKEYAERISQGL